MQNEKNLTIPQGWESSRGLEKWKKGISTEQERESFEALPEVLSYKGHPYQQPEKIDIAFKDESIKLDFYELPKALGQKLIALARANPHSKITLWQLYWDFDKYNGKDIEFDMWDIGAFYALAFLLEHGVAYLSRNAEKDILRERIRWAIDDNEMGITLADIVKLCLERLKVYGLENEFVGKC